MHVLETADLQQYLVSITLRGVICLLLNLEETQDFSDFLYVAKVLR